VTTALLALNSRTFSSLRKHRNYRLFFSGQIVSVSGTWMQDTALPWLVLALTHSPVYVGLLVFARYAPFMLFGLFSGVLADRFDNRRVVMVTQAVSMAISAVLAVLALSGALSALGTANFTTRIAFSWGRDGYLPGTFARTHPRHRTPHVAIAVLALTTLAIFAAGSAWKGQTLNLNPQQFFAAGLTVFTWLLLAGAAAVLPVYVLVGVSGLAHGSRHKASALYGWVAPVVAIVILGAAEYSQFHGLQGALRWAPWVAVAWMAAGIVVRLATRARVRPREAEFDAAPTEPGLQSADEDEAAVAADRQPGIVR
jgi:amino acid transporter